jgi:acyl-CoA synthetase (AMP-forming)/AMP-acid ligase II
MAKEIDALLQEDRTFPPSETFKKNANAKDESVYNIGNREQYWAKWAGKLDWQTKWNKVLEWKSPYAKWFVGGKHVTQKIGAIARPEKILITADLPKTRSGKIMRRLLRDIAEGRALGDVTTLADPTVVASLKDRYEETEG